MSEPQRLAIRSPNWLGDAIMALPAMGAIRRAYPDAHIAIAAPSSIAPLFREETNAQPDSVLTLTDRRGERAALAGAALDAVLLLPNSFRTAWTARAAGIGQRWGFAAGVRRPLLTRAVGRPGGRLHQSQYYLELVRGLDLEALQEPPRVCVSAETKTRAAQFASDAGMAAASTIVGFAPGAAYGHAKRWPPARVTDVIVRLSRESGVTSVLFGAAADRDAGREIESALPPDVRAFNAIGRTDLRLLAGLIARCAAFVSNDSGAMHLAGALGTPLVAIFGPTDERVTAPLGLSTVGLPAKVDGPVPGGKDSPPDVLTQPVFCRPCMLRDCPIDHRCMKRITVDDVLAAVRRRLPMARAGTEAPRAEASL
jgi:heptosyltransferase-2